MNEFILTLGSDNIVGSVLPCWLPGKTEACIVSVCMWDWVMQCLQLVYELGEGSISALHQAAHTDLCVPPQESWCRTSQWFLCPVPDIVYILVISVILFYLEFLVSLFYLFKHKEGPVKLWRHSPWSESLYWLLGFVLYILVMMNRSLFEHTAYLVNVYGMRGTKGQNTWLSRVFLRFLDDMQRLLWLCGRLHWLCFSKACWFGHFVVITTIYMKQYKHKEKLWKTF